MSLRFQLERLAQEFVDFCFMLIPRRQPSRQALTDCRLVSHRGEHDNRRVRENTLVAFRTVAAAGIWGIEFDVRWTRDLHPVVIHDETTGRVFGVDLEVARISLDELRRMLPEVPTLQEVVAEFGANTHMMIELKRDWLGEDDVKAERLEEVFSGLRAGQDYHFLALQTDLFEPVRFAGKAACVLVAELSVSEFSRAVVEQGYGGLCGHYLLMRGNLLSMLHARGQKLGTGFPTSRRCFYRELNREVDWIFTNRALKLGAIRARLLDRQ